MEGARRDDEFDAADGAGDDCPSLALPPLYLLRTGIACRACGAAIYAYALGCAGYREAGEPSPAHLFHVLHHISRLPGELAGKLKAKCFFYFADEEEGTGARYLMNHCRCGVRLDDELLHGEVGAAFWPETPDGYEKIRLFILPAAAPVAIEAEYTVGGSERLDFAKAEPW